MSGAKNLSAAALAGSDGHERDPVIGIVENRPERSQHVAADRSRAALAADAAGAEGDLEIVVAAAAEIEVGDAAALDRKGAARSFHTEPVGLPAAEQIVALVEGLGEVDRPGIAGVDLEQAFEASLDDPAARRGGVETDRSRSFPFGARPAARCSPPDPSPGTPAVRSGSGRG